MEGTGALEWSSTFVPPWNRAGGLEQALNPLLESFGLLELMDCGICLCKKRLQVRRFIDDVGVCGRMCTDIFPTQPPLPVMCFYAVCCLRGIDYPFVKPSGRASLVPSLCPRRVGHKFGDETQFFCRRLVTRFCCRMCAYAIC